MKGSPRALRTRSLLVIAALAGAVLTIRPAPANHVHGGPDLFVTVSDGTSIAVAVVFPKSFDPGNPGAIKYPAIYEMAGYENGSSSDEGRTYTGETADHICDATGQCFEPPLAGDSHEGASAFRYDDDYVSVHASCAEPAARRASSTCSRRVEHWTAWKSSRIGS